MPYEKGQSGNPAGRPLGARNRATIVVGTLLQGQVEPMTRVAMDLALGGDMAALRMCLDRVAPPGRHRPIASSFRRSAPRRTRRRRWPRSRRTWRWAS